MAWDPMEDNLLVSFEDQTMSLVTFQGFNSSTAIVKQFEPQGHIVNNIAWIPDRSGNFVTTNEKVGTIQYWNVASNEPRQSCKIGSKGANNMIMLDCEKGTPRILFALKNGALAVYNLKRQTIEF